MKNRTRYVLLASALLVSAQVMATDHGETRVDGTDRWSIVRLDKGGYIWRIAGGSGGKTATEKDARKAVRQARRAARKAARGNGVMDDGRGPCADPNGTVLC